METGPPGIGLGPKNRGSLLWRIIIQRQTGIFPRLVKKKFHPMI